jgi:hypothetical protein
MAVYKLLKLYNIEWDEKMDVFCKLKRMKKMIMGCIEAVVT